MSRFTPIAAVYTEENANEDITRVAGVKAGVAIKLVTVSTSYRSSTLVVIVK